MSALDDALAELEPVLPRRARVTWAIDIEPEPVTWAWRDGNDGRIPLGALGIGAGREGTGKSSFAIWMASQLTRGLLPGAMFGTPRVVLFCTIEDSWKQTIVPRLIAAEADLTRVGRFDVVMDEDDELMLSLPHDLDLLEGEVVGHEAAMVVLDPLMSLISDRIDAHRSREVRTALDPLARMADRTGATLFGIAHFNKSGGTDAASLISGSGAFKDVPRAVFGFANDTDEGTRVMSQVKNSLGRDDLPSFAYEMVPTIIDTPTGPAETARFTFAGESARSVADVLRDARSDTSDTTDQDEAVEWLKSHLPAGGESPAGDLIKAAEKDGFPKHTMQRARKKAGIASAKSAFGAGWVWSRPADLGSEGDTKVTKVTGHGGLSPSSPSTSPSEERDPYEHPTTGGKPLPPDTDLADIGHGLDPADPDFATALAARANHVAEEAIR